MLRSACREYLRKDTAKKRKLATNGSQVALPQHNLSRHATLSLLQGNAPQASGRKYTQAFREGKRGQCTP